MSTLATVANMREFEAQHPRRGNTEPRRCFAVSINDPMERYAASSGDYFMLRDDDPLVDSAGEPMVLALERCYLVDALTGDELGALTA